MARRFSRGRKPEYYELPSGLLLGRHPGSRDPRISSMSNPRLRELREILSLLGHELREVKLLSEGLQERKTRLRKEVLKRWRFRSGGRMRESHAAGALEVLVTDSRGVEAANAVAFIRHLGEEAYNILTGIELIPATVPLDRLEQALMLLAEEFPDVFTDMVKARFSNKKLETAVAAGKVPELPEGMLHFGETTWSVKPQLV